MQRMKREGDRGAVAVWVAILMVPLMIVAALALDVAGMNADRQRLQLGADAAALAIAQECAAGDCAAPAATAQELVTANDPFGGAATATEVELSEAEAWVEVEASSERDFWFAPVIGADGAQLAARGAAAWSQRPVAGSHLPLAISWCEVAHWAGLDSDDLIYEDGVLVGMDIPASPTLATLFSKGHKSDFHTCPTGVDPSGSNGHAPSGGFGWLVADAECRAATEGGGWFSSSTGRPETCGSLHTMIGETVLVPVFSETILNGSNAEYRIFGYIGFTLHGYRNNKGSAGVVPASCGASADCIHGTIQRFADLAEGFETSPDGPQLGSAVVQLRLPEED